MKIRKYIVLVLVALTPFILFSQSETDSTGYAGDHFSLEGALDLFKNSKSPEDFEKNLNDPKKTINNLDLNEDGEVDYIRVVDHAEGDVHALVLQVAVSASESQDIAVIEIEKTGKESAILQIVGDEEIYGSQVIAEPFEEEEGQNNKGKGGPSVDFDEAPARIVVNVYFWLPIRHIYGPRYVVWVSPWRWRHYPHWWNPWRPHPWHFHWNRTRIYHRHYHVVSTHRVVKAHKIYAPRRSRSITVSKKTTVIRTNKKVAGPTKVGRKATKVEVQKKGQTTRVTKKNNKVGVQSDGKTTSVGRKTTTVGAKKDGDKVTVGRKTTSTKVKKTPKQTTAKKVTTKKTVKKKPAKSTRKKTTATKKTSKVKKTRKKKGT